MKLEDKYNHFGVNRQEAEYFVNKLKNIYGDMYEYYEEDFDPKLELKVSLRKIRIKCKHEEKIVSYKSFIKGMTKCKYCVGKKKIYISPTDIYKQKLLKIAKDTIITDKYEYIDQHTELEYKCIKHDISYNRTPKQFRNSKQLCCVKCAEENTYNDIVDKYNKKINKLFPNLTLLTIITNEEGNYYNGVITEVKCNKHGIIKTNKKVNYITHESLNLCPDCSIRVVEKKKKKDLYEEYKDKANLKHNGKYIYPERTETTKFLYSEILENIYCTEHDYYFDQKANSHLQGAACRFCNRTHQRTREEFIEDSNKIHNNFYTYEKFNYVNAKTKGIITCPIHGDFEQTPDSHLNKKAGCTDCANEVTCIYSGKYNKRYFEKRPEIKDNSCKLYFVRLYNDSESFYKIGITQKQKVEHRFDNVPYNLEVLWHEDMKLYNAFLKEQEFLEKYKENKYIPLIDFKGKTECLNAKIIRSEASILKSLI